LYSLGGSPTFDGCRFDGNIAARDGGGAVVASSGTFTGCTFVRNTALIGDGGALLLNGTDYVAEEERTLVVRSCRFVGNRSQFSGGAITVASQGSTRGYNVRIEDCEFDGNQAIGFGGGVYLSGNDVFLHLVGSRFYANQAGFGGAFYSRWRDPPTPAGDLSPLSSLLLMVNCSTRRRGTPSGAIPR
jgi:hypothetical protein